MHSNGSANDMPLTELPGDTTTQLDQQAETVPTPDTAAVAGHQSVTDSAMALVGHPDTLGRMSTPSLVGTVDRGLSLSHLYTQEDLRWLDYRYLGGILETYGGVFLRDQFSDGQYSQVTIRGADWRSIAVAANSRPMNDPASGVYNLFYFSPEYADRIEVITGPRAFLYGLNSTGGVINFVTKNYNSNRPFSKVNYTESAYNYQYSDGTFTQNVSRKVNLTFGFQHQGTNGRFQNSTHDAWNMRVKIRYNISRDLNIILSEYLTSTRTQLNGGVNVGQAITAIAFENPLQATIKNPDAYEKVNRHDVDLSFVGTFLGDTTDVSLLTLYYSNSFREYRDEEVGRSSPNGIFVFSDHRTSWMGAVLTQNISTRVQRFSAGGNIELRQIEGSPNLGRRRNVIGSVWMKEEVPVGDGLTLAGFGRYDWYLNTSYAGLGADATVHISDKASLFGGFSASNRVPTYQELYWTGSNVERFGEITSEKHRAIEIGTRIHLPGGGTAHMAYFHRTIDDPILLSTFDNGQGGQPFPGVRFSKGEKITAHGVEASIAFQLWVLYFDGVATYIMQKTDGVDLALYPKLSANGGVYFWKRILNDNLDLKVGLRGRFLSSQQGAVFNPEVLAYVPNSGPRIGLGSSTDFFLIARIGNAYFHLMWENLLNNTYFVTPYYPAFDRAARFGIKWEFLN